MRSPRWEGDPCCSRSSTAGQTSVFAGQTFWTGRDDIRHHIRNRVEGLVIGLPQHPDEHRLERPVHLAVDQELGEGVSRGQVAEACRE
jgi:hypothetical protein